MEGSQSGTIAGRGPAQPGLPDRAFQEWSAGQGTGTTVHAARIQQRGITQRVAAGAIESNIAHDVHRVLIVLVVHDLAEIIGSVQHSVARGIESGLCGQGSGARA